MNSTHIRNDIKIVCEYLANRVKALEANLLEACSRADEPAAAGLLTELIRASRARQVSESVAERVPEAPTTPVYLLSALSILEAMKDLTTTQDEDLRFATGLAVGPKRYAITTFCKFILKQRSVVGAEGDHESMTRLLIGLHNIDHKLLLTAHSHPGSGAGSTHPSSVDMDFHKRLEAGNYPAIGMIVNRQGYVRFFSYQRPFEVVVYGKGMEVVDEHECVFKLSSIGSL